MRKQDHLVSLIHSLSPAEKKYFVQHATADGNRKNYLQLYEALLKGERYDADALCKTLGKNKADLANEKKYLETVLLKSLRNCNESNNEIGVLLELASLKVLAGKGLHAYGLARIEKLKAKAMGDDNFPLIAEICNVECLFLIRAGKFSRLVKTNEYRDSMIQLDVALRKSTNELKTALNAADTDRGLSLLFIEISAFYRHNVFVTNQSTDSRVKKYLEHPLLTAKITIPSLQILQYKLRATLYGMSHRHNETIKCEKQIVKLIEKWKKPPPDNADKYFIAVCNLLMDYIRGGKFNSAGKLITAIDSKYYHRLNFNAPRLDELFGPNIEMYKLFLLLQQYLHGQSSDEKVRAALSFLYAKSKYIESSLTMPMLFSMLIIATRLHLLIGEPKRALHWINILVHKTDFEDELITIASARLAQCIAHQELNNYSILPSLVASTKRFYEKYNLLGKVEITTLNFLQRLIKLTTAQQKITVFKQLQKDYRKLEKNPLLKSKLEQVNLTLWAERNIRQLEKRQKRQ